MNNLRRQVSEVSEIMKALDFISLENVIFDLSAPSKAKVLQTIARRAGTALGIPETIIFDALLRREALGSTGVGEGVAIPHTPVPGVTKATGWLAKLGKTIEFDAIDGLPVDIVFVLLTPGNVQKNHLNVLACVARRLRSQDVLQSIRTAKSVEQLYAALAAEP